jgi:hypothetical protein
MSTSKPWYASKTVWFNAVTIIVAVATYFGFTPNQALFTGVSSFLVAVAPVINLGLRFFTTTAIASPATQATQ